MTTEKSNQLLNRQVILPAWLFGFLFCFSVITLIALLSSIAEYRLEERTRTCHELPYENQLGSECFPEWAYSVVGALQVGLALPFTLFLMAKGFVSQAPEGLEYSRAVLNLVLSILLNGMLYGFVGALVFQHLPRRTAFLGMLLVFIACTFIMSCVLLLLS